MKSEIRCMRKDLLYRLVWDLKEDGLYKGFLFTGEKFNLKKEKFKGIDVEIVLDNNKREFIAYNELGIIVEQYVK